MIRRWLAMLGIALGAAALLTACVSAQGSTTPPPAPPSINPWPQVTAYLAAHPQKSYDGWERGILVHSKNKGYGCLNGYCHTWKGTLVLADGTEVSLSSEDGNYGVIGHDVSVGDDLYVDSTTIYSKDDVRIIKHDALTLG